MTRTREENALDAARAELDASQDDDDTFTCDVCGHISDIENSIKRMGQYLCEHCAEPHTHKPREGW